MKSSYEIQADTEYGWCPYKKMRETTTERDALKEFEKVRQELSGIPSDELRLIEVREGEVNIWLGQAIFMKRDDGTLREIPISKVANYWRVTDKPGHYVIEIKTEMD